VFWDATVPDESESRLHRRLKTFAVRALATRIHDDWNATDPVSRVTQVIDTERTLRTAAGETIRADVVTDALPGGRSVAVEAETLFATDRAGGRARDAVRTTVHKYDRVSEIDEVTILVDPLTVFTQGPTLTSVAARLASRRPGPTVSFATPHFETGRLQPVGAVLATWFETLDSDTSPHSVWPTPETASQASDRRWFD
jgi:hypothetical protein